MRINPEGIFRNAQEYRIVDDQPDITDPIEPSAQPDDLAGIRERIIATVPNIIPELITGSTVSQLFDSIDDARTVYERIARDASAVQIPAGGNQPLLIDADQLPTSEKIRRGLASRSSHK